MWANMHIQTHQEMPALNSAPTVPEPILVTQPLLLVAPAILLMDII